MWSIISVAQCRISMSTRDCGVSHMQNLLRTYDRPIFNISFLPAKNLDPQHWNLKQLHSTCKTRGAVVTRSPSCWTLESAEICNTSILWPWHKLQVAELCYYGKCSKIVFYGLKFMFISKVHEKLEENLKDQAPLAACRIQKTLAQRFTWATNIYQTWTVQKIVNLKFYLRETQRSSTNNKLQSGCNIIPYSS
jgi:hypothetical protein